MLEALQADKALQIQFQQRLMENDAELDRLFLADTQNARARDVALAHAGLRNCRASMLVAVAVLLVLVCLRFTDCSPSFACAVTVQTWLASLQLSSPAS